MYNSKQYSETARTFTGDKRVFLAEGDKYKDPDRVIPNRWKGKQLIVPAPKAGTTFNKYPYKPEPYVDRNPYVKTQPLESRKLGFGSHNAKCRDEFMSHIRTEQYREQLKTELKLTNSAAAAAATAATAATSSSPLVSAGGAVTSPLRFPTRSQYDVAKDDRSPRSVYGTRAIQKGDRRETGGATLSSTAVGTGIADVPLKPPEFAMSGATRSFYHRGHVE